MKPLTMTAEWEAVIRHADATWDVAVVEPLAARDRRMLLAEIDALRAALAEAEAELADLRSALAQVMPVDDSDSVIPLTFIARLALPEADQDALTRMGHGAIETATRVLRHELAAMPEDRRNFISSKLTIGAEAYSLTFQREGGKTPADVIVERDAAQTTRARYAALLDLADAALLNDEPWSLIEVLRRLDEGADHLLHAHSCDAHGYETLDGARRSVPELLARLDSYRAARGTP